MTFFHHHSYSNKRVETDVYLQRVNAEFTGNNASFSTTLTFLFLTNYNQYLQIGFELVERLALTLIS